MNETTIVQEVDCVFGENHAITLVISEDNTLAYIGCDCYSHKRETEGLIALGTDEMKTCLGQMTYFLKVIKDEVQTYYGMPEPYKKLLISSLATRIGDKIKNKRYKRAILKSEREKLNETESVVARRLRKFMKERIGSLNESFLINRVDNELYELYALTQAETAYKAKNIVPNMPTSSPSLAFRKKGIWYVNDDWESLLEKAWSARRCPFCNIQGNNDHSTSKAHKRNIAKVFFIALQSTSARGIRMTLDNTLDSKGEPFKFTYRKGMKDIIGVVVNNQNKEPRKRKPKQPKWVDTNTLDTMPFVDASSIIDQMPD
jgi:hypothetical protein